ncbi:hypothetical protein ABZ027_04790 [Streptomyces sp. NPDC006332]|uniref:hypothetical protein n=1 Tax=Streptomyces sp. NPDC006332 TaxID=3155456 RepID=UPI00339E4AE1
MARVWLPSAVWVVVAAASPWAARALATGYLTALPLLVAFVVVGVLGFPLGFGLGRLGARREAVAAAALAAVAATAACAVQSLGAGARWTLGEAAVLVVVAVVFAVMVLPMLGIGFIVGWAATKQGWCSSSPGSAAVQRPSR